MRLAELVPLGAKAAATSKQGAGMKRHSHTFTAVGALLMALSAPDAAFAQKSGGILRIPHGDSPASMSTHEEATRSTATPMMGVFNNLVLFDQHVPQNTLSSIVPDLAIAWSWDEDKTALTFQLRQDVRWHDGRPFSAKDVKCTWDLLTGKSSEKLRVNPRKSWYRNLEEVTVDSNNEVTFHLKTSAALLHGAAGIRGIAGLPLPCAAGADAAASDRHGSIQVR
jgi:ABC-type transport system substrate-binding protein